MGCPGEPAGGSGCTPFVPGRSSGDLSGTHNRIAFGPGYGPRRQSASVAESWPRYCRRRGIFGSRLRQRFRRACLCAGGSRDRRNERKPTGLRSNDSCTRAAGFDRSGRRDRCGCGTTAADRDAKSLPGSHRLEQVEEHPRTEVGEALSHRFARQRKSTRRRSWLSGRRRREPVRRRRDQARERGDLREAVRLKCLGLSRNVRVRRVAR